MLTHRFQYFKYLGPDGVGTPAHFSMLWNVMAETGIKVESDVITPILAKHLVLGLQEECAVNAIEYGGFPTIALPSNPSWFELCAALDHIVYQSNFS